MTTADALPQEAPLARRVDPLGDAAVLIECPPSPGDDPGAGVRGLCAAVAARAWPFVTDLVPAFDTLCIHYDPLGLGALGLTAEGWMAALATLPTAAFERTALKLHELPVCYEGDCGLDLDTAARALGLSTAAVIALHAGALYRVAMIGFAPGFPYLEGLPAALHLPRRACPRAAVPAGSVAVALDLCGIYPTRLPGGWHVLGRTTARLFDPARADPGLLRAGDRVRFVPVGRDAGEALCGT